MGQSGAPLHLCLLVLSVYLFFLLLPARFVLASMHQPTRNKVFRKGESKTYFVVHKKNQARHRRKTGEEEEEKGNAKHANKQQTTTKQTQQWNERQLWFAYGWEEDMLCLLFDLDLEFVCVYVCVCMASILCTRLLHMCYSFPFLSGTPIFRHAHSKTTSGLKVDPRFEQRRK